MTVHKKSKTISKNEVASILSYSDFKNTVVGIVNDVEITRRDIQQSTRQHNEDDIQILFGRVKKLEDQLKKKTDWFSMLQSKVMDFDLE